MAQFAIADNYRFFRVHWDFVLLLFLGPSVVVVLNYFGIWQGLEISLAILAGFFSLALGLLNYRIENDRIFLDLFEKFNARYDTLNEKLNPINGTVDRHIIIDYLNLCSEEYLWFKKGRIPHDVWYSWRSGMVDYFRRSPYLELLDAEAEFDSSYYGFISYLKKYK
jgi:hypothetical protein